SLQDARASGWASQPRPDNRIGRLSQSRQVCGALGALIGKGAPKGFRKPLAPPGAPFPSSEGKEIGKRATRALAKTGGEALASTVVIPGTERSEGARNP